MPATRWWQPRQFRRRRSFVFGKIPTSAIAAATLASITAAGTGVVIPSGAGAATLAPITAAASGVMIPSGAGTATLAPITASGSGVMIPSGAGAATLAPITASGSGVMVPSGAGAATLASITASGTGAQTILASGAATLASITAQGYGKVPLPDPGVRVDVYSVAGTKIGAGPLTTVQAARYGQHIDEIGMGAIVMSTMDPQYSLLTGRVELRVYVAGEGLVFRGRLLRKVGAPYGQAQLELASLEESLIGANSGAGRTFDADTEADVVDALLTDTDFTSGAVGSSGIPYSKRVDFRSIWQALTDHANAVGGHIRADSITLSAGDPVKVIDEVIGASPTNGLIFKTVERLTVEMAENSSIVPLAELSEELDASEIWNRVVVLGPGNGYPMLTLENAQHGENLCNNGDFETDTTGWTPTQCTIARSSVQAKLRTYSGLVSRTSGTSFFVVISETISGDTTLRSYRAGVWVFGVGTMIGKDIFVQLDIFGGSDSASGITFETLVAGWQYVTVETEADDSNSTTVNITVGQSGAAVAGDIFYLDRVTLWESTTYAYCVENEVGPGGLTEYFIEDQDSVATYGRRTKYLAVKDATPTEPGIDAYYAALNLLYDVGRRYLDLHKAPPARYTVKPVGITHVASGVQRIKPATSSRLFANAPITDLGETEARAAMAIDETVTVMGFEREITPDGDNWTIELSTVDLPAMDDAARIAQLAGDFAGSESDVKPYNYTYSVDIVITVEAGGGGGYLEIPLADLLAVHKATVTVQQVKGTTVDTGTLVLWCDAAITTIDGPGTAEWTDSVEYDITALLVQAPTPVPVGPILVSTYLGDYTAVLLQVNPGADGVGQETAFSVVVRIEATKVTTAPS